MVCVWMALWVIEYREVSPGDRPDVKPPSWRARRLAEGKPQAGLCAILQWKARDASVTVRPPSAMTPAMLFLPRTSM